MTETLKKACDELEGKMKDNVCMVNGFPMGESTKVREWEHYLNDDWKTFRLEKWEPEKFLKKAGWMKSDSQVASIFLSEDKWNRKNVLPAFSKSSTEKLRERIDEEKPINTPWVIESNDKIVGHEGRHRSLACFDSDKCEEVPVIVKD